jgi:hypothetical protein
LEEFLTKENKMASVYKVASAAVNGIVSVRWASSEGAAKKARRELMEELDVSLGEVKIESLDVPTSKGGIIGWLNENYRIE